MYASVPWYACRSERGSQELTLGFHVEAESLLLFLTLGCILQASWLKSFCLVLLLSLPFLREESSD